MGTRSGSTRTRGLRSPAVNLQPAGRARGPGQPDQHARDSAAAFATAPPPAPPPIPPSSPSRRRRHRRGAAALARPSAAFAARASAPAASAASTVEAEGRAARAGLAELCRHWYRGGPTSAAADAPPEHRRHVPQRASLLRAPVHGLRPPARHVESSGAAADDDTFASPLLDHHLLRQHRRHRHPEPLPPMAPPPSAPPPSAPPPFAPPPSDPALAAQPAAPSTPPPRHLRPGAAARPHRRAPRRRHHHPGRHGADQVVFVDLGGPRGIKHALACSGEQHVRFLAAPPRWRSETDASLVPERIVVPPFANGSSTLKTICPPRGARAAARAVRPARPASGVGARAGIDARWWPRWCSDW